MKIKQVEIEQFGAWRDLQLPFTEKTFQMIYGPNEAGKSTLMRFVRGILYGFEENRLEGPRGDFGEDRRSGALVVQHRGTAYRIKRVGEWNERGTLTVSQILDDETERRETNPETFINGLTGGTDETLFQNVFAVGLDEVQQLSTLHEDEVGQHIYGLTLGLEGRRIVSASRRASHDLNLLYQSQKKEGHLADLLREEARLKKEIDNAESDTGKYHEKQSQLKKLQNTIEELRSQQRNLQLEQRGCRFLELIWKPWKQVRDYERELLHLPKHRELPQGGLASLQKLDSEINLSRETLRERKRIYRSGTRQTTALKPANAIRRNASIMSALMEQQDWYQTQNQHLNKLREDRQVAEADQTLQLKQLQTFWPEASLTRCQQIDVSPTSSRKLLTAARNYQQAASRRGRFRNRYDKLVKKNQTRSARLNEIRKELGGLTISEAVVRARQQLHNVKRRLELQMQIKAFEERMERTQKQLSRQEERIELPGIAYLAITIFVLGGLLFAALGLWEAVETSWLVGSIYFFLGLTCAGMGWAIKSHFRTAVSQTVRETQEDLLETQTRMHELSVEADSLYDPKANSQLEGLSEENLIDRAYQRLQELEWYEDLEQKVHATRNRLSHQRNKSQEYQRAVSDTRQVWCQELQRIGLPESVNIDETFALWEQVQATRGAAERVGQIQQALEVRQQSIEHYEYKVKQINDELSHDTIALTEPHNLIALFPQWQSLLDQHRLWRTARKENRNQMRESRREVRQVQKQWDDLRTRRSGLLEQSGVRSIQEYEELESGLKRRAELEELLEFARGELNQLAASEPDLAIVEEDLERFNPELNQERLADLVHRESVVTEKLDRRLEESGGLKQQLSHWESNRTLMKLRTEFAAVRSELATATAQWLGTQVGQQATQQIQARYERTQQPEVLANASRYFKELTEGKYHNVWTPLGKRHLCLEDGHQRTFRVEQVSRGTREMLFLAIRMALVQQFAKKDVELPFVLDDVMVNFDQSRTEAALRTLLNWSEQGQQILCFTCHLHLAKMLEDREVAVYHLPKNYAATEVENRWAS